MIIATRVGSALTAVLVSTAFITTAAQAQSDTYPVPWRAFDKTTGTPVVMVSAVVQPDSCGGTAPNIDNIAPRLLGKLRIYSDAVRKRDKVTAGDCKSLPRVLHLAFIKESDVATAKKLGYTLQHDPESWDCYNIKQPKPGTADAARMTAPQALQVIVPPLDSLPAELRGKSIEVIFHVDNDGVADKITTTPALPKGGFSTIFTMAMIKYRWTPALFAGCPFPADARMTFTLQ